MVHPDAILTEQALFDPAANHPVLMPSVKQAVCKICHGDDTQACLTAGIQCPLDDYWLSFFMGSVGHFVLQSFCLHLSFNCHHPSSPVFLRSIVVQ
jgi:hypothetical protein